MLALPFFGFALLIYVAYCVRHGGIYSRRKGWQTKAEAPRSYLFGTLSLAVCGLGMIFWPLIIGANAEIMR
jgi:hypothetical protein